MKFRGTKWLFTAALIVAAMRAWTQLRGKTKTPFPEWAIGWGATFFLLSLFSEVSEGGAGFLALLIAVGDVLQNGSGLLKDVSGAITGAEKGKPTFPGLSTDPAAAAGTMPQTALANSPSPSSRPRSTLPGVTRSATLQPSASGPAPTPPGFGTLGAFP